MKTHVEIKDEETSFTFAQIIDRNGIYCYQDDPNGYVFISKHNHIIKLDEISGIIEILNKNNDVYMNDKKTLYTEKKCVVTLTFS